MPTMPEAEEMQMTRMVRACLGLHGPVHIVRYSAVKEPCDVVLNSSHAILIAWSWAWFKLQIRTRPPNTVPTAKKTKPIEMKLVTPNPVSVPALVKVRMALTNGNKANTRPRKGNLSSQYLTRKTDNDSRCLTPRRHSGNQNKVLVRRPHQTEGEGNPDHGLASHLAHVSLTLFAKPFHALSGMAASIGGLAESSPSESCDVLTVIL